jgi:hypothetical protein
MATLVRTAKMPTRGLHKYAPNNASGAIIRVRQRQTQPITHRTPSDKTMLSMHTGKPYCSLVGLFFVCTFVANYKVDDDMRPGPNNNLTCFGYWRIVFYYTNAIIMYSVRLRTKQDNRRLLLVLAGTVI